MEGHVVRVYTSGFEVSMNREDVVSRALHSIEQNVFVCETPFNARVIYIFMTKAHLPARPGICAESMCKSCTM